MVAVCEEEDKKRKRRRENADLSFREKVGEV
jgi:hypothetical protein